MPSPGLSFALAADFHAFFDETDDSRFGLFQRSDSRRA
jgi:hypothetical protein